MKSDAEPNPLDSRPHPGGWFGIALIALTSVVLYSSTFDHAFHLDSTYGLVDNPSIRSLWNIPQFFWDPFTLTSLRSNADYRPLLQVTFALNHAISPARRLRQKTSHLRRSDASCARLIVRHRLTAVSLDIDAMSVGDGVGVVCFGARPRCFII